jgi:hypothetical protein
MTKVLFITLVLSAVGCTPAGPAAKSYSRPEVGMQHADFDALCKPTTQSADVVSVAGTMTKLNTRVYART